jgi:hypothetical protein
MDGKISDSTNFFKVLKAHTDSDISGLLSKYFQNAH